MKKILFVLIFNAILLSACTDLVDQKHYYVDKRVEYFVDRFYKEAEKRSVYLQKEMVLILIDKIPNAANGNDVEGNTYPDKVIINSYLISNNLGNPWNDKQDSLHVEYLIFHELGHYLLHRGHLDNNHFTIMTYDSWYLGNYQLYESDRKKLIDELFSYKNY